MDSLNFTKSSPAICSYPLVSKGEFLSFVLPKNFLSLEKDSPAKGSPTAFFISLAA